MGTRRDARECAVQMLFTMDLNPLSKEQLFSGFWETHSHDDKTRAFAESLVVGVRNHLREIDSRIGEAASNWDVERMAVVDRNILRLAVYELIYCDDIPSTVSINEAVDMAKYFNSSESGRFVNGILDRASRGIEKKQQRKAG